MNRERRLEEKTSKAIGKCGVGQKVARIHIDANGNLSNDGNGKTYGWDAANRLVSVTQGSTTTGYVYDGWGRRVQETSNGTVVKQWVWGKGVQPMEERDGSNNVTKRFYDWGEQINGTAYFVTKDHLKSVREMTNSSGTLVARYDYDPYGRRTLVSGTDQTDFGFTGFYYDQATGLDLTLYRAYDANLGRWLSRDPIGETNTNISLALINSRVPTSTLLLPKTFDSSVDTNLYTYVRNNVINRFDPLGLIGIPPSDPWGIPPGATRIPPPLNIYAAALANCLLHGLGLPDVRCWTTDCGKTNHCTWWCTGDPSYPGRNPGK